MLAYRKKRGVVASFPYHLQYNGMEERSVPMQDITRIRSSSCDSMYTDFFVVNKKRMIQEKDIEMHTDCNALRR